MFHLKFSCKRGAIMSPGNVISEVAEIIGALHKGPNSEGLVERIKPFCPQRAEEFPVIFKIIFGSRSRNLSRTEGIGDFQVRYPDSPIYFPISSSITYSRITLF